MPFVIPLHKVKKGDYQRIGGKGTALAVMNQNGFNLPRTLCVTTEAYMTYITETGLHERIQLELNRKRSKDMRWEEIWDTALRVRNMFLNKALPGPLQSQLRQEIGATFKNQAVVVRSSAPGEDSEKASFAGLHESYVNIKGIRRILEHIKLVWASLWSDAAMLYRQELRLDAYKCSMAVLVQEIIVGERSGVVFSRSPNNANHSAIEAVYGLNQGLVDGMVAPDRWIIDRHSKKIIEHTPAKRQRAVLPALSGIKLKPLSARLRKEPPLRETECLKLFKAAGNLETLFKAPQDTEWTLRRNRLFVLQSRPITTGLEADSEDKRSWYLSLRKSFDNLKLLRKNIQQKLIPEMIRVAGQLSSQNLTKLTDAELAVEIERRYQINKHWTNVYWKEFIPFAHGVRLFGQFYNDTVRPQDPYEFIDLLKDSDMISLERNRLLQKMATMVRQNPRLAARLKRREYDNLTAIFRKFLDKFILKFGDLTCTVAGGTACDAESDALFTLILEMSQHLQDISKHEKSKSGTQKKRAFLGKFKGEKSKLAAEYLDLARASYQLRDDDNIYLGRIEARLIDAIHEGKRRLNARKNVSGVLKEAVKNVAYDPDKPQTASASDLTRQKVKARQIVGHPAGPGIATGTARVILNHGDLAYFKFGEILVCDAIDPNMTFIVPLVSAIVERRGGMLIHGAIIAREYGLPCVTGVPEAVSKIKTGDQLTVDGYLGIVTVG